MSSERTPSGDPIDTALAEFAAARERGEGSAPEEFCARHPELGEDLRAAVDDYLYMLAGVRREPERSLVAERLGDFKIAREIGRGGMGVVYEAEQVSLRRKVALKVLPAHLTLQPESVERFRREASTAARLRHPGIVEVFTVGEESGTHYFAMELVEGTPLSERIEALRSRALLPADADALVPGARGRSYVAEVARVASEVAEALDYAHKNGVIHRDVKPSNILLRPNGSAVLTDFGLARETSLSSLTQTGHFGGTPHYVSPEQATGARPVDARSDVFSLGVTLYECLTLRRPFDGATPHEVLKRIIGEEPAAPQSLNPRIPNDLATIVLEALEKDPNHRYPTALAMAADLHAFLELRPIAAKPVSATTRVVRWARREPAKATATALAFLLLGGGLFGAGWVAPRLVDAAAVSRRERADEATSDGFLMLAERDAGKAMPLFREAMELAPDLPEALLGYEMSLGYTGRKDEALKVVDAAIARIGPRNDLRRIRVDALRAAAREEEANALAKELGEPHTDVEYFTEAAALMRVSGEADAPAQRRCVELLQRAILASPRARAIHYFDLALTARKANDRAAAQRVADALQTLWPRRASAISRAATALWILDRERSLALRRKAAEIDPKNLTNLQDLAADTFANGDLDGAAKIARGILAVDPNYARARVVLATTIQVRKVPNEPAAAAAERLKEAETELRAAIAADAKLWQAHTNLGLLLDRTDRPAALAEFRAGAEAAPREARPIVSYADALRRSGERKEALEWFARAMELAPEDLEIPQMKARVHRELSEFQAAVELLEPLNRRAPDRPFVERDLGLALLGLQRGAEALPHFRRYLELHPKSTDAHVDIGLALEAMGEFAEAAEAFRTAVERVPPPEREKAREALARCEEKAGSAAAASRPANPGEK